MPMSRALPQRFYHLGKNERQDTQLFPPCHLTARSVNPYRPDAAGLQLRSVLTPRTVIRVNPDGLVSPTPFDYLRVLDTLMVKRGFHVSDIVANQSQSACHRRS